MIKTNTSTSIVCITLGLILMMSCSTNQDKPGDANSQSVVEQAENMTASSQDFEVKQPEDAIAYVIASGGGWIALDVKVPAAGRYRSEIHVSGKQKPVTFWIEDYYDNKDDRTYNITGDILVPAGQKAFSTYSKTGSPLNKGLHKMKLHFSDAAKIDYVQFTLLKSHQQTPKSLTQKTTGDKWEVAWSDEFDGTEIDTTKWTYDFGNWGWGNSELQFYTENRKANARIENGNLVIEARKNDMGEPWTSARLTTRGKVSFLYGKIEFRAKVPSGKGNWAAGWTLGDDYVDELSWPYCGEIDILESVGYEMDNETGNGIAHASAHSGAYYFKLGNQPTATVPVENMNKRYHTYAVEWTPEHIKAFVDGEHYFTYDDNSTKLSWPFNKPHNIILNLAMGGGWGGAMGMDESIESQKMIIDYVRVYERR